MHESLMIAGPLNASEASPAISISSVANENRRRYRDRYAFFNFWMDRVELKIRGGVEVATERSLIQQAPVGGVGVTGSARPFPIVNICFSVLLLPSDHGSATTPATMA